MSTHTPGPWKAGYQSGQCHIKAHVDAHCHPGPKTCVYDPVFWPMGEDGSFAGIVADDGSEVVGTHYDELKIGYADARLIAAAPEMYEALRVLLDAGDFAVTSTDEVAIMLKLGGATDAARAVLAKIDGGQ